MSDTNVPWYIAAGSTIIAALSSALTYLFKLHENDNSRRLNEQQDEIKSLKSEVKEVINKADKCEDDRATLFAECQVLKERVTTLSQKVGVMDIDGTKHSHRNDISGKS